MVPDIAYRHDEYNADMTRQLPWRLADADIDGAGSEVGEETVDGRVSVEVQHRLAEFVGRRAEGRNVERQRARPGLLAEDVRDRFLDVQPALDVVAADA